MEAGNPKAESPGSARVIRRALVAAAVALVVVAVVLVLTSGDDSGDYEITAEFTNASQLVSGNVVTIGGTDVGRVGDIRLADNGNALVDFSVDEAYAPLHRGTIAQVRSFSLSGVANRQVELTLPPAGRAGEEIPDDGLLTRSETVSEVDLDQLFNTLDDKTVADFKNVIKGFATSYSGVGEDANRGFKYLNPFLSTSRRTFAELTRDAPALEQLIVNGAKLSNTVASRRDDLSALVGNLDGMMNAIARQRTALTAALSQLPGFMRNFNTTAVNLRTTLDDLDPLVEASMPVADRLGPFFRNFRGAAADLVPTVRDLDRVVKAPGSDNDVVDLTRLQPRLARIAVGPVNRNGERRRGALPESSAALRDSLDELAFLRAYSPELTGWFDDFGHSGIIDANGGIGRIGTTFNTFPVGANNLPIVDLAGLLQQTAQEQYFGAGGTTNFFDIGNYRRCPGANERPAPDGSNPWTDGGTIDCNPALIPPGP
ncbi:MAG TPA: MlaD family protein [Solirubrobacterales bacterium]|nr:MlaD family protein [Solirubrobacterales bacterium]